MPPVNIAPMMDHPGWKTLTPDQRKQALALWQDKDTSDDDRVQMGQIMDRWATASDTSAQAPAPPQQAQAAQPPAEEPITPERRFLDLPAVQALPLEERTQRFQDFYGHSAERKDALLRAEEPPARPPEPMERFLALPSIANLTPAERAQVQQEFQGLTPAQQEEVISREVPRDLHQAMERPAPSSPPATAATAPRGPASSTQIEALTPYPPQVVEADLTRLANLPVPPEAAIAAIPGMAGYAIGMKIAPALGAIGKAVPPLLEAAGGYLGRRANVALGYEEEGKVGDVLSVLPLVTRGMGSATAGWFERTIKDAPVAARNQTLDLLGKLFSRGGAPATLTYALSGDPQMAAFVGGSTAVARQLLEFGLRHPAGKQLVESTLKAGRAIGGEELGMLINIGRTGQTATPHSAQARDGKAPVDIAPMMNHPAWAGKLKTAQQRQEALKLWQDKDTSEEDRAEMLKVMDGWLATP